MQTTMDTIIATLRSGMATGTAVSPIKYTMSTQSLGDYGDAYSTVHDAITGSAAFTTAYLIQYLAYTQYDILRALWAFNTSQLTHFTPSAARIKATILILEAITYNDTIVVVDGSGATFGLSDYGLLKNRTTPLGSILIDSSVHNGDSITIPLNAAGIALLNQSGLTKFAVRLQSDIDSHYLGNEYLSLSNVTLEMDGVTTDSSVKTWYTGDPLAMPSIEVPAGAVLAGRPNPRKSIFVGEDTVTETIFVRFYQPAYRKATEVAEVAAGMTRLIAMVERAEVLLRTDPTFGSVFVNSEIVDIDPLMSGVPDSNAYRIAQITLEVTSRAMWGA